MKFLSEPNSSLPTKGTKQYRYDFLIEIKFIQQEKDILPKETIHKAKMKSRDLTEVNSLYKLNLLSKLHVDFGAIDYRRSEHVKPYKTFSNCVHPKNKQTCQQTIYAKFH